VSRARYQAPVLGRQRRVPYARVTAHVASLGLAKTPLFRLRIFTSFSANCAGFALFSLQFGFVKVYFGLVLGSFFHRSSFVFKYFLASFPLFLIFCSSPLSPLAGATRFWSAPLGAGGHGLRRIVSGLNTIVG